MSEKKFLSFLNKVIFSPQSLDGKWKKKKFRFMYVLRCIAHPVVSIQYYYGLQSLNYIDDILMMQPILPAKIHRPYLHKGGASQQTCSIYSGSLSFCTESARKILAFFSSKKIDRSR